MQCLLHHSHSAQLPHRGHAAYRDSTAIPVRVLVPLRSAHTPTTSCPACRRWAGPRGGRCSCADREHRAAASRAGWGAQGSHCQGGVAGMQRIQDQLLELCIEALSWFAAPDQACWCQVLFAYKLSQAALGSTCQIVVHPVAPRATLRSGNFMLSCKSSDEHFGWCAHLEPAQHQGLE